MRALLWLVGLAGCGRLGFDSASDAGISRSDGRAGDGSGAPSSGLVGWWKFDEGTGTIAGDFSPQGNTADIAGTSAWTTNGKDGGALALTNDGHLELEAINGIPTTGSFTVAAWVNLATFDPGVVMSMDPRVSAPWVQAWTVSFRGAGESSCGDAMIFWVASDGQNNGACRCGTTGLAALDTWYHLAAVYDASVPQMDVYFDGQPDDSSTGFGVPPSPRYYDPTYLGNIGEMSLGWRLQGTIDDLRVYDRALDAAEIGQLYLATGGT